MKTLTIAVVFLVACGGGQKSAEPAGGPGSGVVTDTRSDFDKRLETACAAVGKKLTACAVADTDAKLAAGEIKQKDHDELVKPQFQDALTSKYVEKCDQPAKRSSRQIRVLEVCLQQEPACDPLLDCLDNLNKP